MLNTLELLATVMETVNTDLPPTAVADFQAGVFMSALNMDVRENLNACFVQDSDLAAGIDTIIKDVEAKDYKSAVTAAKALVPNVQKDVDPCMKDDKYADVQAAYKAEETVGLAVKADSNAKTKIITQATLHALKIKKDAADLQTKFDSGDYYGAGQVAGEIEAIVLKPWMKSYNDEFLQ